MRVHVKVDDDDKVVLGVIPLAYEADDRLFGVIRIDPLEALLRIGVLPKRRVLVVEPVERRHEPLLIRVALVLLGQEVLDALVVAPLDELRDLVAHEVELAPTVGHLVEGERPHAGELAPVVAGLTGDERALAVHDLVV